MYKFTYLPDYFISFVGKSDSPPAPRQVTGTPSGSPGNASIQVNWLAPVSAIDPVQYLVELSTDGSNWGSTQTIAFPTLTYTYNSLPGSVYYARVRAGYASGKVSAWALSGQINTPTYEAETLAWKTATEAAGGSVSSALNAIDAFVKGCKTDGIWVKLSTGLIIPLASDGIAGLFVPLVAPAGVTLTNNNFVSGDYSLATGLDPGTSNSTKYIATTFNASTHLTSSSSAQLSFYSRRNVQTPSYPTLLGYTNSASDRWQIHAYADPNTYYDCFSTTGGDRAAVSFSSSLGLITGSRTSDIDSRVYRNGAQVGATQTGARATAKGNANVYVFFTGPVGSGAGTEVRICAYAYIGPGLTPSEELLHYNRVQNLQTALGRNV